MIPIRNLDVLTLTVRAFFIAQKKRQSKKN